MRGPDLQNTAQNRAPCDIEKKKPEYGEDDWTKRGPGLG